MLKLLLVLGSVFSNNYCYSQKISYPTYNMEDICTKSQNHIIKLGSHQSNSSLLIKSYKTSKYRLKSCTLIIESSNENDINANVKNMESNQLNDIKSYDSITLTKLKDNKVLVLEFSGSANDFEIIITAYRAIKDNENCPQSYFLCERNKCIDEIFRCDSYLNCDNDENEIACAEDITPGNTVLITIILGILGSLFGTTCLLSSFVYFKYYKHRNSLIDSKQRFYGTVNGSVSSVSTNNSLKIFR